MKSKRSDGRGHWPKGTPRNAKAMSERDVRHIMFCVRRALKSRKQSQKSLAAALGCSDRTLGKWLSGLMRPDGDVLSWLTTFGGADITAADSRERAKGYITGKKTARRGELGVLAPPRTLHDRLKAAEEMMGEDA